MQAHGQAHQAQLSNAAPVPAPVRPLRLQDGVAPQQPDQTPHPRQPLGQHGSQGRAEHVHAEGQDEQHIQGDVDQGGDDQPDHRRAAVPQGAQGAGAEVVEEVGRQSGKNSADIGVGALEDVRRRVHGRENAGAQEHRPRGEDRADEGAQPHAVGDIPAQLVVVAGPELLGHRDGKAAAHTGAETHHQEVDGPGGSHRRQGRASQGLAHDGGVHHVVELLEQVPEENRDAEAENQPHRAAFC